LEDFSVQKGQKHNLHPVLTLPKTHTPETLQLVRWRNRKASSISFLMKQKYLLSLILLPKMQKLLKGEEQKGTSVPLFHAMGKEVTTLYGLHRNLRCLLYQCCLHAQHTKHYSCRGRLQTDTLISLHQVRPRELVCNLLYPPSCQEESHSCSGRSHSDLTLPQ